MRRSPVVPWAVLVLAAVAAGALTSCGPSMTPPRPPDPAPLTAEERARALDELAQARAVGDVGAAAAVNGRLARDARLRARRVLDYWLARRDPKSGLWAHTKGRSRWVPQNTGADLWPHLLSAAYELAPEHGPVVAEALARERAVCGALPCTVLLSPVQAAGPPMPFRLAQAAEYAADGLLPPAERYGRGPWFDRLVEVTDALVAEIGPRAATGDSETDGNLLQTLARLAHATRDDRIVAAAERMADRYLLEWIPAAGGLPPRRWDFDRGAPASSIFRVRDHGAEILPGLAEVYLAERALGRPAAARHREPLRRLLARALAVERAPDGLWRDSVDLSTGAAAGGVVDTWGYLLAAYVMTDLADGTHDWETTVSEMVGAAAARAGYAWEGGHPDGPADAIESMLLLLPFSPSPAGDAFVDAELPAIFAFENADGSAGAGYLDGNVIRTALLCAGWKSAGVSPRPPREDLALGAERTLDRSGIILHFTAASPWSGRLVFDSPRHRLHWSMPFDYPRRNAQPEWFAIETAKRYRVTDLDSGVRRELAGAVLLAGLEVEIGRGGGPVRLEIRETSRP
jgi:hypothetical protein